MQLDDMETPVRPPGQSPGQIPEQDRGAKTRPQGQLKCASPRGSPGGGAMVRLGID